MSKAALEFVKHGFALVPIEEGSKAPKVKGWNQPENLITSAEQARQLNGCNLGLAHVPSGTGALDVDDYDRTRELFKPHGIDLDAMRDDPKNVFVDSGQPGRMKILFRLSEPLPTRKLGGGAFELRCASKDGSTVQDVIHGKHPSGTSYTVRGDLSAIPPLPKKLLALWRKPEAPQAQPKPGEPLPVVTGGRNDYLTSKAGELRHIGMSEAAILGALRGINEAECKPPLAEKELRAIARSVARYEPAEREAPPEELVFSDFVEFAALKIPPRRTILAPWIQEQGLVMVHGWRGVGKTNFGLSAALAVATGTSFGPWKVEKAWPVAYLDFEMDAPTMQKRMLGIVHSIGKKPAPGLFKLYTPDMQPGRVLNLASDEDQAALEAYLDGSAVVFIDNLSTGFRGGAAENDAESAEPMISFGLAQRRAGRAVVFLHHSNKNGAQRGTSRREDTLDTVLKLEHPADYMTEQGARFTVEFEKARGFFGEAARSLELALKQEGAKLVWTSSAVARETTEQVLELHEQGLSQGKIAKRLGINQSNVSRALANAKLDGKWKPSPKKKGAGK